MYSGTVSDFSGSDALIIKDRIRTEQYDLKHLNGNFDTSGESKAKSIPAKCPMVNIYSSLAAPDFVSSLEDEDHVYFFLREAAVEYINCGKVRERIGAKEREREKCDDSQEIFQGNQAPRALRDIFSEETVEKCALIPGNQYPSIKRFRGN